MAFGRLLATIQTAIILFLTYFFVLGLISLVRKVFRLPNLFEKKLSEDSFFYNREPIDENIEKFRRQF